MGNFNQGGGFRREGGRSSDEGGYRGGGSGGGGFRSREGGSSGGGFRGGSSNFGGPREMHDATCSECGAACKVPFKPMEGKPVYCRDCYSKKKGM